MKEQPRFIKGERIAFSEYAKDRCVNWDADAAEVVGRGTEIITGVSHGPDPDNTLWYSLRNNNYRWLDYELVKIDVLPEELFEL